ncbi:MAG: endolytic transglycosylase MltG [Actinobacteria bacterium]|nr:endolytic transglycosylase MltG [Actinomycetota bacterium]
MSVSSVRTPGRERTSRKGRALALVALVAAGVAVWFLVSLFQPLKGDGTGRVVVSVPKGAGASQIGKLLANRDVVSSQFFFSLRAGLAGKRSSLGSGRFVMRHGMSYGAALDALTKAPAAPRLAKLTIPEGRSRREIAPIIRSARLRGGYLAASKASPVLKPRNYGGRAHATLEGFLFPATYDIRFGAPAADLVAQQLNAFRRNFATLDLRYAKRKHLTRYDVITIASMIEREAAIARERPLIAAVIYNRLHDGMPIGIDATIRYRLNNWSRPLKVSELRNPTAYNTRLHPGLPPTPIGNPGLASLRAAHSRSPAMQNAALAAVGLDGWRYQHLPVTPALFAETVRGLPGAGFAGANVTIPHKEIALALADDATEAARAIGAANTLTFSHDGSVAAANTDAPGLIAALRDSPAGRRVLLLGAGGSARAAAWALREAGAVEVLVWNRSRGRARALARDLGVRQVDRPQPADLLVNCTSVGLAAEPHERDEAALKELELEADDMVDYARVVDLVPRSSTPLLRAARAQGVNTVDGLEVLVHQGALSFEHWTGLPAPVPVMRQAASDEPRHE